MIIHSAFATIEDIDKINKIPPFLQVYKNLLCQFLNSKRTLNKFIYKLNIFKIIFFFACETSDTYYIYDGKCIKGYAYYVFYNENILYGFITDNNFKILTNGFKFGINEIKDDTTELDSKYINEIFMYYHSTDNNKSFSLDDQKVKDLTDYLLYYYYRHFPLIGFFFNVNPDKTFTFGQHNGDVNFNYTFKIDGKQINIIRQYIDTTDTEIYTRYNTIKHVYKKLWKNTIHTCIFKHWLCNFFKEIVFLLK